MDSIYKSILMLLCIAMPLYPAISDFQSDEYKNQIGLDIINAAGAYDKGYTGKGVKVGVYDNINPTHFNAHSQLNNKLLGTSTTGSPNDDHGLHVAGIIAANKDGIGMHGVAYDASLKVAQGRLSGYAEPSNLISFFNDVKIINFSVGGNSFPTSVNTGTEDKYLVWKNVDTDPAMRNIMTLARSDKVIVFGGGNDYKLGPSYMAAQRRYHPELGGYINVINLDSSCDLLGYCKTTKGADGVINVKKDGLRASSNLAKGVEIFSITAPGSAIYSLGFNNSYSIKSGTSMAAPHVSGVAALVAEAFPWMNARQIADVVLSSANKNFKSESFHKSVDGKLYIYVGDNDTAEAYKSRNSLSGAHEVLSKESVFGQGILDADAAVGGLAEININRMTSDDKKYAPNNVEYALYTLNFDGQAVFSNDIKEVKWDDKYHLLGANIGNPTTNQLKADLNGKSGGIYKDGTGTLILQGNNTYTAPTVIHNGYVMLNKRDDNSGGVLSSDVYLTISANAKGFGGDGIIKANLINTRGMVAPGRIENIGSSLSINGNYTQEHGDLNIYFNELGKSNFIKANNITINASTFSKHGGLLFSFVPTASAKNATTTLRPSDFLKGNVSGNLDYSSAQATSTSLIYKLDMITLGSTYSDATYTFNITKDDHAYQNLTQASSGKGVGALLDQSSYDTTSYGPSLQQVVNTINTLPTSQEIDTALRSLSAENYNKQIISSVNTQHTMSNTLVLQMLGNMPISNMTRRVDRSFEEVFGVKEYEILSRREVSRSMRQSAMVKNDIRQILATRRQNQSGIKGDAQAYNSAMASVSSPSSWNKFATLVGSYSKQKAYLNEDGYKSFSGGIFAGIERVYRYGALGGNLGYIYRYQNGEALKNYIHTNGVYLGFHARVNGEDKDSFFAFLSGRAGAEYSFMERHNVANVSNVKSFWLSPVYSGSIGAGKNYSMGAFTLGPSAWLNYTAIHQPEIKEIGGIGLNIQARNYQSLQGNVGAFVRLYLLGLGGKVSFEGLGAWSEELLSKYYLQSSAFSDYAGAYFLTQTPISKKGSLLLQLKSRWEGDGGGFFQLMLNTRLLKKGYTNIEGALSIGSKF